MRLDRRVVPVGLVALAFACGDSGGVVEPQAGGNVIDGIAYTASVQEIVHQFTNVKQVSVKVTLTNTTDAAITKTYPSNCPARIRFYRVLDEALVYDESQRPCAENNPATITIPANDSRDIVSGVRNPWEIHGDSLPAPATYYAAALVRIVGLNPIEIDAGQYRLPFCKDSIPPPPGIPFFHCQY